MCGTLSSRVLKLLLYKKSLTVAVGTLVAALLGMAISGIVRDVLRPDDYVGLYYLQFPGALLSNTLNSLCFILTVTGLVVSVTSLGPMVSTKLVVILSGFIVVVTVASTIIAAMVCFIMMPLTPTSTLRNQILPMSSLARVDAWIDLFRNAVPSNILLTCFETKVSSSVYTDCREQENFSAPQDFSIFLTEGVPDRLQDIDCIDDISSSSLVVLSETNYLGVIVLSFLLANLINYVEQHGDYLRRFMVVLNQIALVPASVIVWCVPFGSIFLSAAPLLLVTDYDQMFRQHGDFIMITLVALAIHSCLLLPLCYFVFTGRNPCRLALQVLSALTTGLVTGSSHKTLPVTIENLIDCGIKDHIINYVAPICAVVCRDGSSLLGVSVCLYVASINAIPLGFVDMFIICCSVTLLNIFVSEISSLTTVPLIILLSSVGLPSKDINNIVAVHWLISRFTIVSNVWGHCVVTSLIDYLYQNDFGKLKTHHIKNQVSGQYRWEVFGQTDSVSSDDASHR